MDTDAKDLALARVQHLAYLMRREGSRVTVAKLSQLTKAPKSYIAERLNACREGFSPSGSDQVYFFRCAATGRWGLTAAGVRLAALGHPRRKGLWPKRYPAKPAVNGWPRVVQVKCERCRITRARRVRNETELEILNQTCRRCASLGVPRVRNRNPVVPDTLKVTGEALLRLARNRTAANPGSEAKIAILQARVELIARGELPPNGLFHPEDVRRITVSERLMVGVGI